MIPRCEDSAPAPVPAGGIHLLQATTALAEIFEYGVTMTVCGLELRREELAAWECPDGCTECDHEALHCSLCVAEAAAQSATAAADSGTGPGRESASNAGDSGGPP